MIYTGSGSASHQLYKVLLLFAKFRLGLAPKYLCDLMGVQLSARSNSSFSALVTDMILWYLGREPLYASTGLSP